MMKRDGDVIDFSIDGKKFDSVNIKTGQDAKQMRRDAAHAKKFAAGRKRPGRNDPCPCGSGRKYKKCCLKNRLSF
ncbi:MAG: SEC-C metal-binding domain-containing protein [Planctomycetota bacterium]